MRILFRFLLWFVPGATLLGTLAYLRPLPPSPPPPAHMLDQPQMPAADPTESVITAGAFRYPRYEGDRLQAEVEGAGAQVTGEMDYVAIKRPRIRYFHPTEDPQESSLDAEVAAGRGTLDRGKGIAELSGQVVITATDGSHLSTEFLRSDLNDRSISSDRQVRMRRRGMELTGTGLAGDANLGRLTFASGVLLRVRGDDPDIFSLAPRSNANETDASLPDEVLTVACDGPGMIERMEEPGARHRISFRDRVRAVRVVEGRASDLLCRSLVLLFEETPGQDGQPDRMHLLQATATGGVQIRDPRGSARTTQMLLTVEDDGARNLLLLGPEVRVAVQGEVSFPGTTDPRLPPPGEESLIVTCTQTAVFRWPPPGIDPQRQARFLGSVHAVSGDTELFSEELTLLLLPDSADPEGLQLSRMDAEGNVLLLDATMTARGGALRWEKTADELVLLGGPRAELVRDTGALQAERITFRGASSIVVAEGNVEALLHPVAGASSAIFPVETSGAGSAEDVSLTCSRLLTELDRAAGATRSLRAEGNVQLVRGPQTASGDLLVWEPEAGRLRLQGAPVARIREGDRTLEASEVRSTGPGGAVVLHGRKRLYLPAEEREVGPPVPATELTCRGPLIYIPGRREIRLRTDVRARQGEATLWCDELRILLGGPSQGPRSLRADGHVRVVHAKGRATGDQAVWEAGADEGVTVRGLPWACAWDGTNSLRAEEVRIDRGWTRLRALPRYRRIQITLQGKSE